MATKQLFLLFLFDLCDRLTHIWQMLKNNTYIRLEVLYFSVEWVSEMPGGHYGDVYGKKDPNHQEQLWVFHNLQKGC